MNDRVNRYGLHLLCLGLMLLTGCFPEDSLDWSADGSIGLLRAGGKLYVVDGHTGALSPIPAGEVMPWPVISDDGKRIAYAELVRHATLAEGLKVLPTAEAKMLADDAQSLRERILSGALAIADFNSVPPEKLGYAATYRNWVVRFMCENADEQLAQKLGAQVLQQGKTTLIGSSRLVVVSLAGKENKKTVATSALGLIRPRFSPDGRYVAYLAEGPVKEEEAYLFVTSFHQNTTPMYVASKVSLSFDWRQDGQALAYLQQEGENTMLGVVRELKICDPNGKLLDEVSEKPETPLAAHRCTGESKQLAGTLVNPLMKVQYGVGGRLFFSSASGKIPSSDLDEPKYSLFCYDFATGTVADVLPSETGNELGLAETVNFFSLSPDGRKVLLPMKKGRFAIYELGSKAPIVPIRENEGFGEDLPKILPAWKGNDRVSCQVSQKSHFLTDEQQKRGRNEIVVLDTAGNLKSVLSSDWPDDALPKD